MKFKGVKQSTVIRTKTSEVYYIITNFSHQFNVSTIMAVQMAYLYIQIRLDYIKLFSSVSQRKNIVTITQGYSSQ